MLENQVLLFDVDTKDIIAHWAVQERLRPGSLK